ncbi:MAG: hypothetical protein V1722_01515 [Candidatus Micrarchaeota archaeon]
MNYNSTLKNLGVNALFWTGIVAIALTLLEENYYFLLFFVGLVVLNFVILLVVNKFAPNAIKIENIVNHGQVVFKLKPLRYPQVLDEEKNKYVPELIHLDIANNKGVIFAGDVGRSVLKQLRDSMDQALAIDGKSIPQKAKRTKVKQTS